jgi:putative SOS response-associated peptidase YedK
MSQKNKLNFSFPEPSTNISSGQICPILVSAQHFNELSSAKSRHIVPALWGLIPRWHKGNYREHEFNTSNFRIENNVNESRMYKPAFTRGKRCAMICEGYYEWMRNPASLPVDKRPIHFIRPSTNSLLHIAGIFDVWYDDDERPLFSFTVLSIDSSEKLNWLHPRMPVILETDEQVQDWLNFSQVSGEMALKLIRKSRNLFHTRVKNTSRILKGMERDDDD